MPLTDAPTLDPPVFPPGVHDVVRESRGRFVIVQCTAGDWWVAAHANNPGEIGWATRAAYSHAAHKRGRVCHEACIDEHGHIDGCAYDDEYA